MMSELRSSKFKNTSETSIIVLSDFILLQGIYTLRIPIDESITFNGRAKSIKAFFLSFKFFT